MLPARKPREEPPEWRLHKNKQCEKMALPRAFALVAFRQGHRKWGRGDNDSGAHQGAHGLQGSMDFRWPMEMTLTNQFVEHRRPFLFLEITSKSGKNCVIFFFFFGVHKAGDAQYLSCPRAHVWTFGAHANN